jgi:cytosine/adenosine deaminase-related metal-dependent hydrolase
MIHLKGATAVFGGEEDLDAGDILVEDGRIRNISREVPTSELRGGVETVDCSGLVLMPGMVNTHHHFFQTLQRCVRETQDSPLFDWLTRLYQIWKHLDRDAVYWSTLVACGELLKTGCTMTSDNLYVFPREADPHFIDVEIEAARTLGIRFHPTRGSMSLGKSKGGLPPDEIVQTEDEILRDSIRLIDAYHDPGENSMLRIALGPCSPFSVSEDLLKETAALARDRGVLLHTHLAETEDENAYCLEHYGTRPLGLMERVGWLGRDVWFAHGIHLSDAELDRLAGTSTGVCHCPTSNMRLGSGTARVPEMLERGIRVGLGVDGSASNDTSDMMAEARNCFLLQRLSGGSSAISARRVLRASTRGGADLLGRKELGRLEEGAPADIIGIDLTDIAHAGSLHDPVASVVMCGCDHRVAFTMVGGRMAVRDGMLVGTDEAEIVARADQAARRMISASAPPSRGGL